jgi:hypothetical protein
LFLAKFGFARYGTNVGLKDGGVVNSYITYFDFCSRFDSIQKGTVLFIDEFDSFFLENSFLSAIGACKVHIPFSTTGLLFADKIKGAVGFTGTFSDENF